MSGNKPEVKLISKPKNLLKTIYTACRACYSADSPINIYDSTVRFGVPVFFMISGTIFLERDIPFGIMC